MVSLCKIRLRSADRSEKGSRRCEEAPASQTSLFVEKGHKERGVMQGIGGGEREPNDPETGYWQS
jgi:hypothetical protein